MLIKRVDNQKLLRMPIKNLNEDGVAWHFRRLLQEAIFDES